MAGKIVVPSEMGNKGMPPGFSSGGKQKGFVSPSEYKNSGAPKSGPSGGKGIVIPSEKMPVQVPKAGFPGRKFKATLD